MVGGVGYMAGKAGARHAAREAEQGQRAEGPGAGQAAAAPTAAAPQSTPGAHPDKLEQLKQLGELRDSGVLTPEEFEREKQQLLGGA